MYMKLITLKPVQVEYLIAALEDYIYVLREYKDEAHTDESYDAGSRAEIRKAREAISVLRKELRDVEAFWRDRQGKEL